MLNGAEDAREDKHIYQEPALGDRPQSSLAQQGSFAKACHLQPAV